MRSPSWAMSPMGLLQGLSINVSLSKHNSPTCSSLNYGVFDVGSQFGGILDMVTDRISTCGLLVILSGIYPVYMFYFILLILLDISSHWFHVMRWEKKNLAWSHYYPNHKACPWIPHLNSVSSHHKSKEALEHRSPILQWYYSIYPLFGYCCVGAETFYILLYIIYFYPHPLLNQVTYNPILILNTTQVNTHNTQVQRSHTSSLSLCPTPSNRYVSTHACPPVYWSK
jgi:hypothetical protein